MVWPDEIRRLAREMMAVSVASDFIEGRAIVLNERILS
jgi:hypothetical protein